MPDKSIRPDLHMVGNIVVESCSSNMFGLLVKHENRIIWQYNLQLENQNL